MNPGLGTPRSTVAPTVSSEEEDIGAGSGMSQEAATAEEQKMYEALVEPMLGLIHGEETAPKIQERLKNGDSIAQLTYEIANVIVQQIEQSGKEIPHEPLEQAAEDIVEDLVEISVAMGLIPDEQEAVEQAFIEGLMGAIEMYGVEQRKAGKMTSEQAKEGFDKALKMGGFSKTAVAKGVERGIKAENEARGNQMPAQQMPPMPQQGM